MQYRLKRDLVIPSGTVFKKSPNRLMLGAGCHECQLFTPDKMCITTLVCKLQNSEIFEEEFEEEDIEEI